MKKKIFIGIGVVVILLLAGFAYLALVVNKRSPEKTTTYTYQDLDIKVVYCQPSKKGRLIFGEEKDGALQPFGKYWRLGANAATEITFSKNINFAGKPVNAGTYSMYAVPGSSSFQVTLNSEFGQWGYSEPDHTKDVLTVGAPVSEVPETEMFVVNFSNDSTGVLMDFVWDKTSFRVPITKP
jgi:Protein of unknown function (DUF2911)